MEYLRSCRGWLSAGRGMVPRRRRMVIVVAAGIAILIPAGAGIGDMLVIVALMVFVAQTGLALLPVVADRFLSRPEDHQGQSAEIWLSVHVPIHDEPPHLVIATLQALARQEGAPRHEIIVLDNNTADPRLWRPVEDWCHRQGAPFRFYHCDNVAGAKAGALNIALAHSDDQSTHVVVVDADYVAARDFLRTVATALASTDADFLQFPQAFEAGTPTASGLAMELADYFRRHARLADRGGAMLLTGTMSVVRKSALKAIGGWSTRTATEDAETGLSLLRAGYRGRYVDRIVGRGLMALDLEGLKIQRARWAKGNARALVLTLAEELRHRRLGLRDWCLVVVQLTAWINLTLPAVLLACATPLLWFGGFAGEARLVAGLSLATIAVAMASAAFPLLRRAHLQGWHPTTLQVALMMRLALQPTAALATLEGLLPRAQSFCRTSKMPRQDAGDPDRHPIDLRLPGLATATFLIGVGPVAPALAMACLFGALSLWTVAQAAGRRALADYASTINQGEQA